MRSNKMDAYKRIHSHNIDIIFLGPDRIIASYRLMSDWQHRCYITHIDLTQTHTHTCFVK